MALGYNGKYNQETEKQPLIEKRWVVASKLGQGHDMGLGAGGLGAA